MSIYIDTEVPNTPYLDLLTDTGYDPFDNITSDTKPTFELIYLDEMERDMVRLPFFNRIKRTDLKGDYSYVFLFHLPPGTRPVAFNISSRKQLDLRRYDLVAPD